jgi:hypothetical protein
MSTLTPCAWRCGLLSWAILAGPFQAQGEVPASPTSPSVQAPSTGTSAALADILVGIVHYTRWPSGPATMQFCVDDRDALMAQEVDHRLAEEDANTRRDYLLAKRKLDVETADSLVDCQVVYFDGATASLHPALLIALANRSILTIGRGEDFCSYGGLFCLSSAKSGWRVQANLDAISRSGLRVNPQLLRLTQRDGLTR